jgi:hypothetical protein
LTPSQGGPTIAAADAHQGAVERREGEALPATRPPVRALLAVAGAALVAACGGTSVRALRPEYDLRAPDPELRTRAVAWVAETNDASQVPTLIFLLDDDDGAVRAASAATLQELTGHDTGYRAYMDRIERRRHQEMWRAWWAQSGRGTTSPAAGAVVPPPAPAAPTVPCPPGGEADVRRP